ncbi:hypothetical protein IP84_05175 [beta proteobacterium AAP99]|nr:hypothetical protein IP84_05175 [beta proteobacterium AAP99]
MQFQHTKITRRAALQTAGALGLAGLSGGLLSGCGNDGEGDVNVRLLNLMTDVDTLTLRVDGKTKVSGVAFETGSGYAGTNGGNLSTEVIAEPGSGTVSSATAGYAKDNSYTVVASGTDTDVSVQVLNDGEGRPDDGRIKLRVLNNVARGISYDVYLTASTASIDTATATLRGVGPQAASGFAELASGIWRIRIYPAGDKRELLFDADGVQIDSRQVVTLVLYTLKSSRLVNAYLLHGKDSAGASRVVRNTRSRVRFVNGTDVFGAAGQVRFTVNGQSSSTLDANFSAYQVVAAGTPAIAAVRTTDNFAMATATQSLNPGRDYLIVVYGTAGNYRMVVTQESNLPARGGRASLNVVNATADGVSIDASVDFSLDFPNLEPGKPGRPVDYGLTRPTFSVRFCDAQGASQDFDGGTNFADPDSGGFKDMRSYLLVAMGQPGARRVVLREFT